jgi:hypothetical protein
MPVDIASRSENTLPSISGRDEVRFWEKVRKTRGCWYWQAGTNSSGYGVFWLRSVGKNVMAHRVPYWLAGGEIAHGKRLHHTCYRKLCVRPDHLVEIGLDAHPTLHQKTRCLRGHPYSSQNTYAYVRKDGRTNRMCRTCMVESTRRWRTRR